MARWKTLTLKFHFLEARKIEPDFEVGEEVSEEVKLIQLGHRGYPYYCAKTLFLRYTNTITQTFISSLRIL
jgi:hypothetical protein